MALTALSPAQHRVLALIASGLTGPEIAEHLGNSPWTIQRHKRNILHRLKARTAAQAVAIGFCTGALQPTDIVKMVGTRYSQQHR